MQQSKINSQTYIWNQCTGLAMLQVSWSLNHQRRGLLLGLTLRPQIYLEYPVHMKELSIT